MNDTTRVTLTPRERLARSRADLLQVMDPRGAAGAGLGEIAEGGPTVVRRNVLQRWWARHPAHAAYEWLEPALHRYARRNPRRLVGYAASVGGLLALSAPLRWLAFSGALALVTRGPGIADAFSARWGRGPGVATDDRDANLELVLAGAQPVVEVIA